MIAAAYANGVIAFAGKLPGKALPIASGDSKKLRDAVVALARLAYDGKTLLVPGIPEAANEDEKILALERFCARVREALRREDQEPAHGA